MLRKTITLITGANQGIGYETAKNLLLGNEKWHILLGSRNHIKGEEAVAKLTALPNVRATIEPWQIDVTDDASVDGAASAVEEKFGRLDILVNNAGIGSMQTGREGARKIFETNVIGVISTTDAFLPLLRKAEDPRVVFVSSTMGCLTVASDPNHKLHMAFATEYRASKAALNMLMVQYQHRGVMVHGFDPGAVATYFGGIDDAYLAKKRANGAAEPEDAAEVLVGIIRGERDAERRKVVDKDGVVPW